MRQTLQLKMLLRSGFDTYGSELYSFLLRNLKDVKTASIIVTSVDRVVFKPKLPLYMIINESNHNQPGSHWIALTIDKNGMK